MIWSQLRLVLQLDEGIQVGPVEKEKKIIKLYSLLLSKV